MNAREPQLGAGSASLPGSRCTIALVPIEEAIGDGTLYAQWQALLAGSTQLDALYQSPEWCEHLLRVTPGLRMWAAVARDESGALCGVVPVRLAQYVLRYDVAARSLWDRPLATAFVMGSQPLFGASAQTYAQLLRAIWERIPACDAVYMNSVPTGSVLWQFLETLRQRRSEGVVCLPDGIRPHYWIALPENFEEYLAKFSSRKRYNLRTAARKIAAARPEPLRLVRVETPEQVEAFVTAAAAVSRRSWQQARIGNRIEDSDAQRAQLLDLARRGMLRSYLLQCGGTTYACAIGWQHAGTYHGVEIAFDQDYAELSPGTVLLYLIIEDVITHKSAKRFDLGIGAGAHKQQFSNASFDDASVLVLAPTAKARLLVTSHALLRALARTARKLFAGRA